jgi:hypothetical protein
MKTPQLEHVVRTARALPEDERTPYAFEKRVMALILGRELVDRWALWSNTMWRAAFTCVAISLIAGALTRFDNNSGGPVELFAADLEQTVLAPIISDETW